MTIRIKYKVLLGRLVFGTLCTMLVREHLDAQLVPWFWSFSFGVVSYIIGARLFDFIYLTEPKQ